MDDKREIGKKIWELFSKNYTYSEIAKELGVSKSVVSNVINYCSPPKEQTEQNIKELKETYQRVVEQIELKNRKIQQKLLIEFSLTTSILVFFSVLFIFLLTLKFNIFNILNLQGYKLVITILVITILAGAISFFIAKFINKKDLEDLKNEV